MKHKAIRYNVSRRFGFLSSHIGLISLALIASYLIQVADCEAKEFDWADLGVLSNAKTSLSNNASNNLRILVSPQRRMTKNYEFEYGNNSQPISPQGETSYLVSSSSYTPLSAQPQSSQSSAYSALSASLASLKSRLSARGVSIPDTNLQTNLYPTNQQTNSYSLSESQPQTSQHAQNQQTYLSLSNNQQDPQQTIAYNTATNNQSNDNKTIVLAIPAKINFLTEGRSSQSTGIVPTSTVPKQQLPSQQHNQQLAVLQSSSNQQPTTDYQGKQIGIFAGTQEGNVESNSQMTNQEQESPQYVIVNNPRTIATNDQQSHLPLTQSQPAQTNPTYNSAYPTIPQTNYNLKYMQTYQPQVEAAQNMNEQYTMDRYSSCLNTCNSADPRWRKYTVSKYKFCCSRSAQYDSQFEQQSVPDRTSESVSKFNDDAYYHYLYRKTRARRSRRPHRASRYNRYSSIASSSHDDESSSVGENGGSESSRQTSSRPHHYESPYMKYYKSRQQQSQHDLDNTRDGQEHASSKYQKERSYRSGRSRDFDNYDSQQANDQSEDEGSVPETSGRNYGYGSGEHSVDSGRYVSDSRNNEEEDPRSSPYDDQVDQDSPSIKSGAISEYPADQSSEIGTNDDGELETPTTHKKSSERRRKSSRSWPRKHSKDSSQTKSSRRGRKLRLTKQQDSPSNHINGTDYDATQSGSQYSPENSSNNEEEHQKDRETDNSNENGEVEKDTNSLASRYKASLNETAVAHLSKTTMHLKEILTILEKKAQIKLNDTSNGPQVTSTPSPATTTNSYTSIFNSQSHMGNSLGSGDHLASEISSLKSPYSRFEPSSLSSPLSSSSLALSPSYSSLTSDFSTLSGYSPTHFSLPSKHLPLQNAHYPRKRRVNKSPRYNNMMYTKPHNLIPQSSLLSVSNGKNALLNPAYYSLQYPYWYGRGSTIPATTSYPYKNANKNPYSILSGQSSSKLPSSAGFYSDESRIHSLSSYDPLSNVASSIRPSTTMRLRTKPFVFQPHVVPIYTRHTILTPSLDVKK